MSPRRARSLAADDGPARETEILSGLSVEAAAGLADVTLGVLALLDIVPGVLLPAALVALGVALFLDGGGVDREMEIAAHGGQRIAGSAVIGPGGDVLVGIAGVVLGSLALVGCRS